MGWKGVISVAANGFPKAFSEMVRLSLAGDFRAAKALNDGLIAGYEIMFAENNPAGIKAAMAEQAVGNFCPACTPGAIERRAARIK